MQSPGPTASRQTPTPPAASLRPARSPFPPLFLWLLLQLIALAISAARVPFYATKSFPRPAELLALPLMLIVQVIASALLFPFLLRDVRAAVMVMAAGFPLTLIAGFLTATADMRAIAASAFYVSAWLAGLAAWRGALTSARAAAIGVAAATFIALGGPLFWYLRAEYGGQNMILDWAQAGFWGPIMGALAIFKADNISRNPWVFMAAHLSIGTMAIGVSWVIRRRGGSRISNIQSQI